MRQRRIIVFSTAFLFFIQILALVLSYLRDILIVKYFGGTKLTDAWYIASSIPGLLFKFMLFGALGASFLPVFAQYLAKKKEQEGWYVASSVINFSALVLAVVSLAGVVFAPFLVRIFAPGFTLQAHFIAVKLARLLLFVLVFIGLSGFLSSVYRAYFNFVVPAIASILPAAVLIFFIIAFSGKLGIYSLGWGSVWGYVLSFSFLLFFLSLRKVPYRLIIDLKHPQVRSIFRLMVPLAAAEIIGKGIGVVDRMFASGLYSGSVTALFLANRVVLVPVSLFTLTSAAVIFPFFSRSAVQKDKDEFRNHLSLALKISLFFVIPSFAGIVIFFPQIVQVLFEHGKFSAQNAKTTAQALFFISFGLCAYGLKPILARCFYALRKNWVVFKFELLGFVLNIILDYFLVKLMGVAGIALATSCVTIVSVTYLLVILKKEVSFKFSELIPFICKIVAAAAIMSGAAFLLKYLFFPLKQEGSAAVLLLLSIFLCAGVFFLSLKLLKTKEISSIWALVKRRRLS